VLFQQRFNLIELKFVWKILIFFVTRDCELCRTPNRRERKFIWFILVDLEGPQATKQRSIERLTRLLLFVKKVLRDLPLLCVHAKEKGRSDRPRDGMEGDDPLPRFAGICGRGKEALCVFVEI